MIYLYVYRIYLNPTRTSGLMLQAVAPASQADGLGVTPGWRLHEVNNALVETAEEKLKSLENEAEACHTPLLQGGSHVKNDSK